MAITLSTAARNAACDAVVDLVEGGTGPGNLVIKVSGGATTLATIAFAATAFGNSATGVATAASLPLSVAASATGTAAEYEVQDGDATVVWSGTVTATGGGGDLELSTTSLVSGVDVNITAFTHDHPA